MSSSPSLSQHSPRASARRLCWSLRRQPFRSTVSSRSGFGAAAHWSARSYHDRRTGGRRTAAVRNGRRSGERLTADDRRRYTAESDRHPRRWWRRWRSARLRHGERCRLGNAAGEGGDRDRCICGDRRCRHCEVRLSLASRNGDDRRRLRHGCVAGRKCHRQAAARRRCGHATVPVRCCSRRPHSRG